jgi:hypothetical protein
MQSPVVDVIRYDHPVAVIGGAGFLGAEVPRSSGVEAALQAFGWYVEHRKMALRSPEDR